MALGKFADVNLATTATLSEGDWSVDLPLNNILDDSRYIGRPARCLTPGTLADSTFKAVLERARTLTLIGVLFHTLSITARYRLTVAGPGGDLNAPILVTGWEDVHPRLQPSLLLPWEEPNWWTGQASAADLEIYAHHLWIPVTNLGLVGAIRIEFDDAANEAGYFDIGGLWLAASWSPAFNFDRGRQLDIDPRDLQEEGPSGRLFNEVRTSRRRVAVKWSTLSDIEAYRLVDAGARAGISNQVLFVPDIDSGPAMVRETYPATFDRPPSVQFTYDGLNTASATFKEIIA